MAESKRARKVRHVKHKTEPAALDDSAPEQFPELVAVLEFLLREREFSGSTLKASAFIFMCARISCALTTHLIFIIFNTTIAITFIKERFY